jgi:hypothetical protein
MKKTNNLILNPSWVTGFTDAEGCFSVILTKRPNLKWRIMVSFEINLHYKDICGETIKEEGFHLHSEFNHTPLTHPFYRLKNEEKGPRFRLMVEGFVLHA